MCVDLSIIIPVYNAEKWISKMLRSIIYNNLNVEIILINDGSTDNSANVCKLEQEINSDIRYFEQKRHGVSYTRNRGITLARGKYITFFDADDYLSPDMITNMYHAINNSELDMVVCNYVYEDDKGNYIYSKEYEGANTLSMEKALELAINRYCFGGYLWNKIFRKSLIDKYSICFDSSLEVYEDLLFVINYLKCCKKIMYLEFCGYHYVKHLSSSLAEYSLNKYCQRVQALDRIEKKLMEYSNLQGLMEIRISNAIVDYIKVIQKKSLMFQKNIYSKAVAEISKNHIKEILGIKKIKISRRIILLLYVIWCYIFYRERGA